MYYFGLMLSMATIYMLAGLGATLSLKTRQINLAGEGLVYAGGFICAVLLDYFAGIKLPSFIATSLAFITAAAVGAVLMLLCEFLRKYRNADFLLTSFITSSAIIPLIDGLIAGPFRTKTGNLLATPYLIQSYRFTSILKPSPLNASIFAAVVLCIAAHFFFAKTKAGNQVNIYGISPRFSHYSGFNCTAITFTSAGLSGALHAIAGCVAVCGTYFTCHSSFYVSMGWNALSVAMLARTKPILLIPFAVFVSALMTYSNKLALYTSFDFDLSMLIQAVILFIVATSSFFRRNK
ncbi:MAG: ABC transporter permease [Treponema sp.]|nr:ABC transporter permease [Treponema sp.]